MKSGHEIGKKLLLRLILENEAESSKFAALAYEMSKEYAKCFSELKVGDKVVFKNYSNSKKGLIQSVRYDTHDFFRYIIKPLNKNLKESKRSIYSVHISSRQIMDDPNQYSIRKLN